MGKDLKGKDLGVGIYQHKYGYYCARYVNRFGKRKAKRFKKLQECRQWIAEATYIDEHSDLEQAAEMTVDAWFEYWIEIKKRTVRPNTVRNYTERYERNIKHGCKHVWYAVPPICPEYHRWTLKLRQL